mmetsp:Transcript_24960/g.71699  ORF Transcript_24960/g.71699 Transcript_24960/m.71699 type:complete len:312 (+) Transcript_24960:1233-2168(+)
MRVPKNCTVSSTTSQRTKTRWQTMSTKRGASLSGVVPVTFASAWLMAKSVSTAMATALAIVMKMPSIVKDRLWLKLWKNESPLESPTTERISFMPGDDGATEELDRAGGIMSSLLTASSGTLNCSHSSEPSGADSDDRIERSLADDPPVLLLVWRSPAATGPGLLLGVCATRDDLVVASSATWLKLDGVNTVSSALAHVIPGLSGSEARRIGKRSSGLLRGERSRDRVGLEASRLARTPSISLHTNQCSQQSSSRPCKQVSMLSRRAVRCCCVPFWIPSVTAVNAFMRPSKQVQKSCKRSSIALIRNGKSS